MIVGSLRVLASFKTVPASQSEKYNVELSLTTTFGARRPATTWVGRRLQPRIGQLIKPRGIVQYTVVASTVTKNGFERPLANAIGVPPTTGACMTLPPAVTQ